ncbi:MAG: LuxR C-terminal-related transcriptional regulator, partial [Flavobacteriaceae bacterium]|nr:LuxR C-terminal-related transcriptional regulator [Flavobacteriaceae bacterium]
NILKKALFLVIFLFLMVVQNSLANGTFSLDTMQSEKDSVSNGLTSLEWKKFKKFEAILQASDLTKHEEESQLTGYARDSLRILEVKLVAIKVLNEKNLLNRDIAENPLYYSGLLQKLKASDIAPSEYLFLEEKLAYINQGAVTEKLKWSTWLNAALIVLIVILAYLFLRQRNGQSNPILPELSKQETLVRNLILQGKSNKEIATELFISLSTVKSHITNIYSKLNVTNRRELLENSTGAST